MNELSWSPGDLPIVVAVLSATVAYLLYHYAANAKTLQRILGCSQPASVYAQRLLGGVFLGGLPLLAMSLTVSPSLGDLGLVPVVSGIEYVLGGGALLFPLLVLASRRPAHRARYPQARPERWTARGWVANAASWAVYLLGYELLFRGVLLFTLAASYGPWPAIALSTGLYVFAHLPKDAGETVACVAMGTAFGALALSTGGIWAAFALHLVIAVTSDSLSLKAAALSRADESDVGVEPLPAETRALELA